MNDVDRQILSLMRDVEIPEQGPFYLSLINDNIDAEIRESHLRRLDARGLIEEFDSETADVPTYGLTAQGLQAILTEDLDQTLETTNQELSQTVFQLEKQRESQSRSSAVQTIFSISIILFTTSQVITSQLIISQGVPAVVAIGAVGVILSVVALIFGWGSLRDSWSQITR
jgi:hypothetical protein